MCRLHNYESKGIRYTVLLSLTRNTACVLSGGLPKPSGQKGSIIGFKTSQKDRVSGLGLVIDCVNQQVHALCH